VTAQPPRAGTTRAGEASPAASTEPITSVRNPRVRALAALAVDARTRRTEGRHLVEGPHAVGEALAAGVVEELLLAIGAPPLPSVPDGVRITPLAPHVLERLADTTTPQGVVAVCRTPQAELADVVGRGVLVVLDAVADPGNAGTILRTADAAGAAGVVFTAGSVDPYGPKALRAAAGSTYHLPVVTGVDVAAALAVCREHGQRVLGLDGAATASVFDLERDAEPVALVLGNEAHGLSPAVAGEVDGTVAVPLYGRAESLNVAAAAAIAIYAAARSRAGCTRGPITNDDEQEPSGWA
jgi:RNA methyltransferase, TrmH family